MHVIKGVWTKLNNSLNIEFEEEELYTPEFKKEVGGLLDEVCMMDDEGWAEYKNIEKKFLDAVAVKGGFDFDSNEVIDIIEQLSDWAATYMTN